MTKKEELTIIKFLRSILETSKSLGCIENDVQDFFKVMIEKEKIKPYFFLQEGTKEEDIQVIKDLLSEILE